MKSGKDHPLTVSYRSGEVVIRIGANVLASAFAAGSYSHAYDEDEDEYFRNHAIVDVDQFAKDVVVALQHEDEDGSGPLTKLFDVAIESAIYDNGSTGVSEERIAFGKFSSKESFGK